MIFDVIGNSSIGAGEKVIILFSFLLAISLAIVCHEVAHGYAAYLNGDLTAKFSGRLTLNPFKHFDPIGFVMLATVGFGWAKPVPVDPRNFKNYKKGMVMVSLAGVVTNLLLATVFAMLLAIVQLILKATIDTVVTVGFLVYLFKFLQYFCIYSITINLTLMAFNILPIYPLDGFRLVETLAKPDNKYVVFMRRYGMLVLLALLVGGSLLGMINPYLDLLGTYIRWIQNGVIHIFSKIFGI